MKHFLITILAATLSFFSLTTQAAHPIIAQYFGIWSSSEENWAKKMREDTLFTKCNRVYVSFGKIIQTNDGHYSVDFDGPAIDGAHARQLIARIRNDNPSAELLLTVGGNGSTASYGGAASDLQFAPNISQFLKDNKLDGFDINWEEDIIKTKLTLLLKNMYSVLHNNQQLLTLDVWPRMSSYDYDTAVLDANVDQINVMSYGTGLPLEYTADTFIKAGFPAEKVIGGIEVETDYNQFNGVTDTLGDNGSIAHKAKYALAHRYAGMMSWRLDADYAPKDDSHHPTYQGAIQLWKSMTVTNND